MFRPQIQKTRVLAILALLNLVMVYWAMNSFERGDDPVVSAFFDVEHALIKLVKILKAEDK